MPNPRLSYEDSCKRLQKDYLGEGVIPPIPNHMPRYDDEEELGVSFFRTFVGDGDDLSNLYLPHTYFGRSKIQDAAFCNTDFTESSLCWNDFIDVDFTDAVLRGADMRASIYTRVKFVRSDMRNADLRHSTFKGCEFSEALMAGATASRFQRFSMRLSSIQIAEIRWTWASGEVPEGG